MFVTELNVGPGVGWWAFSQMLAVGRARNLERSRFKAPTRMGGRFEVTSTRPKQEISNLRYSIITADEWTKLSAIYPTDHAIEIRNMGSPPNVELATVPGE
ncbi:hypothetical protein PV326_005588 [Microctonus aethiopoides]|nr:hypothetical protein PV326_005588 [Microctonus aethiopoides]